MDSGYIKSQSEGSSQLSNQVEHFQDKRPAAVSSGTKSTKTEPVLLPTSVAKHNQVQDYASWILGVKQSVGDYCPDCAATIILKEDEIGPNFCLICGTAWTS